MSRYILQDNTFIIKDYDTLPPFSSFLPGLAGIKGIPLWSFFVNRGQGIASFGIHHKNNAIMEFFPANEGYENTPTKGFRTFIKCDNLYFEAFRGDPCDKVSRNMYIDQNTFSIEEINNIHMLKVRVDYFILPNEDFGALVRNVTITNLDSSRERDLQVVDGMPKIIPFGITNEEYKAMSNLLKSWAEVNNIDHSIPIYNLRSTTSDSAQVGKVTGGYYYLSMNDGKLLSPIYDADLVFGQDTGLNTATMLKDGSVADMLSGYAAYANKVPCGFSAIALTLTDKTVISTLIGYTNSAQEINSKVERVTKPNYIVDKYNEAATISGQLVKDVYTKTANNLFDRYIGQCYLDNFLRGGYPFVFEGKDKNAVVHLFSRKHGDPERDYNFFSIAGEYYSQGNGNFRDVNQNRRNDIFFNPKVGDYNVKTFFSLIQADGYNPLEVRGSSFTVDKDKICELDSIIDRHLLDQKDSFRALFGDNFTPGQVINYIFKNNISLKTTDEQLLTELLDISTQNIEAVLGEGYWSDHFTYNMDLIDSYLRVFPDKKTDLIFKDNDYAFFDSPLFVRRRTKKHVVTADNEVRQYDAVYEDEEKLERGYQKGKANWLCDSGKNIVKTNLYGKMITLAVNKFSALDPYGMGIEMEANKPGWNDAMNGLPGLLGSGMSETFELKRLISFMLTLTDQEIKEVTLPCEVAKFVLDMGALLDKSDSLTDFEYWDSSATLREDYRDTVRFNLSGDTKTLALSQLNSILSNMLTKLNKGIDKAVEIGNGIPPTYFTYKAEEFEPILDDNGNPVLSDMGLPTVRVVKVSAVALPYFLEAPAKMLKGLFSEGETEKARALYQGVKSLPIYDTKLKMYKTSVPLDDISMENGRIRAFTAGWLERESVFLHMEYKFLLGILESGLYDEYFEEMQNLLIPYLSPEMYGRSILENSSFIASSVNPNKNVHGRGFVSRLSGSTTEVLSMWIRMFMGNRMFSYENGSLNLYFNPILPSFLFDDTGVVEFNLLSSCRVVYHNPARKNTYGKDSVSPTKLVIDDNITIEGDHLPQEHSIRVRNGEITKIDVYLS